MNTLPTMPTALRSMFQFITPLAKGLAKTQCQYCLLALLQVRSDQMPFKMTLLQLNFAETADDKLDKHSRASLSSSHAKQLSQRPSGIIDDDD